MRTPIIMILSLAMLTPLTSLADKGGHHKHHGGHHEHNQGGVPPGLAKKGGLPPGIAKKFGASRPEKAYVAFDPRYDDRAWFLIDGRWILKRHFDAEMRLEVRHSITLPAVPIPPVPLPKISASADLHVVLFQ